MRYTKFIILIGLISSLLLSCDTYKTYYNETTTQIPESKKDVLRLDISESNDIVLNVEKLKNLRMLDLSTRDDIHLDSLFLKLPNPEELRVLIIDSLDLNKLPESIRRFKRLQQLSLNANPSLKLDNVIATIKDIPIEFLNFQHNEVSSIPASIKELTSLEDFNLSNNHLNGFDHFEFLSQIKHLNSLWLTNNELVVFPESLGRLEQLRNLYIEHNSLTNIPKAIIGMKKVWVIHAGHNLFSELPTNFGKMKGLILVHINNCQISTIPEIYNKKRDYSMLGLIIDNNKLSLTDKDLYGKKFSHFFVLSF